LILTPTAGFVKGFKHFGRATAGILGVFRPTIASPCHLARISFGPKMAGMRAFFHFSVLISAIFRPLYPQGWGGVFILPRASPKRVLPPQMRASAHNDRFLAFMEYIFAAGHFHRFQAFGAAARLPLFLYFTVFINGETAGIGFWRRWFQEQFTGFNNLPLPSHLSFTSRPICDKMNSS